MPSKAFLVRHRIATEYILYSVSILRRRLPLLYEHGEIWLKDMDSVVEKERKFHAYEAHIRLPNFIFVETSWISRTLTADARKEIIASLPDVLQPDFSVLIEEKNIG